jgi:hypothetical protein
VYDALSALIAEQAGFEALYLSGASIAYTRLGRSDIGLTTYSEVEDVLARITERVHLPVIVDADTGFGNALNVQRTVRGFERAGAAMMQLEDQTFPKRCGHLDGKTRGAGGRDVRQAARRAGRTAAQRHADPGAHRRGGRGGPGCGARPRRGLPRECGADALFIEALRSPEQMDAACSALCRTRAAAGQHGRRRQDAGAGCRRTGPARLSHRHLSRAAPPAPWRTRWRATTPACTSTSTVTRGASGCSTSTG